MSTGYWVLNGRTPIKTESMIEWAQMFESKERIVAKDTVDGCEVSTVFLGIDHNFGIGEPLLFETMIFGGQYSDYCERYSTWQEAEDGHREALQLLTNEPSDKRSVATGMPNERDDGKQNV